jgi:flagellin
MTVGGYLTLDSEKSFSATGTTTNAFGAPASNTATLKKVANLDVSTYANSQDALKTVDSALKFISGERAKLGALQSRFDSTVASLQVSSENMSAARSRIQDADFASETANLSRAQILQQAGTAMVAQANQLPQGVLALLR